MSSIPHLFVPFGDTIPETIPLPENVVRHAIGVLRMRDGEAIRLFNGRGIALEARLRTVGRHDAFADVTGRWDVSTELPIQIQISQALPKQADRLETVLQHGTELGATAFVIFPAKRTVSRWEPAKAGQRIERWERIVTGAAEQSHRTRMPTVQWSNTPDSPRDSLVLVLHESASVPLAEALPATAPESVELRVGPEGGLTDDEVAHWVGAGAVAVHLGPRILRTETAALAAVSRLIGHYRL